MQRHWRRFGIAAALPALIAAGPAQAQDFWGDSLGTSSHNSFSVYSDDHMVELRGGFGATAIEAREYVYNLAGSKNLTSMLVWQSVAPMASVGIDVNLPDDWTLKARARAALSGDSYMEDYDWFGPDFVDYAFDNWTHRSQHPNTNLDWFLDASLSIGRNLIVEPNARLNLNGGFKYIDVQWSAVGGSYVYSDSTVDNAGNNFRAYSGNFADIPAITYRQKLPVLFAGLDGEVTDGQWTYRAEGQAGLTFMAATADNHWMRDLLFIDRMKPSAVLSGSASVAYDFSDNLGAFLEGSIQRVFDNRADTEIYDASGTLIGSFADSGGADLGTISLTAGIKGSF